MSSTLQQQRTAVATALSEHTYAVDGVVVPVTVIEKPYRPIEVLAVDLKLDNPRIMVTGVAYDERIQSRNTKARDIIIRCFIESYVKPSGGVQVDGMLNLVDQVQNVCSGLSNWLRTPTIIDEHGLPYLFHVLREKAFFQAVIHPTYLQNVPRGRQ